MKVFARLVGNRYRPGSREVKLTYDRFPNRIENKRYLIIILENLILEAKKIVNVISNPTTLENALSVKRTNPNIPPDLANFEDIMQLDDPEEILKRIR